MKKKITKTIYLKIKDKNSQNILSIIQRFVFFKNESNISLNFTTLKEEISINYLKTLECCYFYIYYKINSNYSPIKNYIL